MLMISLNVRHGGGGRAQSIADWIIDKIPDIVVLTEWRDNNSGKLLKQNLENIGLFTAQQTRPNSKSNGLLVAAREPFNALSITPPEAPRGELLLAELQCGVRLLASYFPQGRNKTPFFDHCIATATNNYPGSLVVIGDLNTGRNDLDIEGSGAKFDCADIFADLPRTAGLVDLWRHEHGDRREWSWRSQINGFRIDHAFANDTFLKRHAPFRCWFDHEPRNIGLTDHSALLLSWSEPNHSAT